MNPDFWNSKSVLITGHTGFKGSWLSLWLQKLGARVTGYALPANISPSMFEVTHVAEGMTSIEGDICDLNHLKSIFREYSPEIVIHMAAQSLVRYSYQYPVETYTTNVIGTVNLFEAIRATPGIRAVLNVTSDKCYDNKEWNWGYRENEALGGYDPYSSSKACSELVTAAYRNSYFSNQDDSPVIASARAGNVIGGGDWAQYRLIPDIIKSLSASKPVYIRNPSAVRPWQHVLEPLNGYLTLLERMYESGTRFEGPWNFGPDSVDSMPVSWIADVLCRQWSDDARWESDDASHPHEAGLLRLDSTRARIHLGWRPDISMTRRISQAADWYRAYQNQCDMHKYTMTELSEYEQSQ